MEGDSEIQTEKKREAWKRGGSGIVVDETIVKTGSEVVWLWVATGPKYMRGSRTGHIQGEKHVSC